MGFPPKSLILLGLIASLKSFANSEVYKSIIWSPQNPIFQEEKIKCVFPMSKLTIVCPSPVLPVADSQATTPKERSYENLWLVDRWGYDNCQINETNSETILLMKCNTPLNLKWYTIMFQKQSATAQGLEFESEKEYYFLATSDGTLRSLDSTTGGHCETSKMRLQFHICKDTEDLHCKSIEKCQELNQGNTKHTGDTSRHDTKRNNSKTETRNNKTTVEPCSHDQGPRQETPPNTRNRHFFMEIKYRFAIGFLLSVSLIFMISTIWLGYKVYKKSNSRANCTENGRYSMHMTRTSESADSADGVDTNELLRRRDLECRM